MNETRRLLEFIGELNYESLPSPVVEIAKLCILDTMGVGLFGSRTPWANVVAGLAVRARCEGESSLWRRDIRTTPEYAALANGTAAHGIEMDDRKPDYDCHTGSIAVPTAMALAESMGADGRTFITSVVAGYECAYRVGRAVLRQMEKGIHAPTHKGIWGAVAAASKALGLNLEDSLSAFGIAGHMASGIFEFSQDPERATVKRLHGGWPAHSGTLAALMARDGLTGPSTVLEGKFGYCRTFAGAEPPRIEEITRDLGHPFMILGREVKPYAAWGGSHTFIEAASKLKTEHGINPDMIEEVTVGGSQKLILGHEVKAPKGIMAGQYSLSFVTAVAFFKDLRDPSIWTDELLKDEQVLTLAGKVNWQLDEEMDKVYRETHNYGGAKLTVRLRDGKQFSATVHISKGTMGNPMTPEEIAAKFNILAGYMFPSTRVDEIRQMILSLDSVGDVRELGRLLMLP